MRFLSLKTGERPALLVDIQRPWRKRDIDLEADEISWIGTKIKLRSN